MFQTNHTKKMMEMNKLFKKFTYILAAFAVIGFTASCGDDIPEEITSIETDRLFSPTDVELRVINKTSIRVNWKAVTGAVSYDVEVFETAVGEGTIVQSAAGLTTLDLPYVFTGFDGETNYTVRIKALSDTKNDSKWIDATVKTETEQIFQAVASEDLEATQVVLRWTAGQTATSIILTPADGSADINYTVTADDIAAGAATITGLTGEVEYTAVIKNGEKTRGSVTFTTPVDIGNATLVEDGDDLAAMLAAATEGEVFAIMPGEYALGEFSPTKSFALKGVRPADKPIITGSFKIAATVTSIELNSIILDGNDVSRPFDGDNASCKVGSITISDCTIRNYKSGFIYANKAEASFGDITISNSIIEDITGDGGGGIDFRAGSLGSFSAENVTFSNGFRDLLRLDITTNTTTINVTFKNCTFYKVCTFDNSNNTGLFRIRTTDAALTVSKCLFVNIGVTGVSANYGNWCSGSNNMKAVTTYSNNYYYDSPYLWVGLYTNPSAVDATEGNPGFADAANGDFTISNEDMIFYEIGDARWR